MPQDRFTVRAVVIILGLVALAGLGGAVLLVALHDMVPTEIWTLPVAALAGLTGLLASTRVDTSDKPPGTPPAEGI